MKLKNITLIALFTFVGFFAVLFFLPTDTKFLNFSQTPSLNTNLTNTNITNTTGVGTFLSTEEVAKHNTASDCYIIIRNSVYDVTLFINKHPGGKQGILGMCGKEASTIFSTIHSNFAWNLLKNFFIGELGTTATTPSVTNTTQLDSLNIPKSANEEEYKEEYEDD